MWLSKVLLGDTSTVGLNNTATREKWLKKTLDKIPGGQTILDAGAGEGRYKDYCRHLQYTSQDFAQYDGVGDGSGVQTGTWDNSKLDIVSDIANIPVPDNSFENIMCIEVIEHVPDAVVAIKELTRILKPGGLLIITAPFASLTHFSPYHFATGFNKYFFSHWSEKLKLDIIEISHNGNYFEFLAQELRYSEEVSFDYTKNKPGLINRIAMKRILAWLQKNSANANESRELLAFGIHFIGRKKEFF